MERDLGITLDSSQVWFRTAKRRYVIIDAPGHREFLKNMVTGAAAADAALLVVDVAEGVSEQTRRHACLLQLLGVRQVAVVLNKIDSVDYDPAVIGAVQQALERYLAELGLPVAATIPISAKRGANVAGRSDETPWYAGPTVIEALDAFQSRPPRPAGALRLPLQDVYRRGDRRILVGRIESGALRVGDRVAVLPSRREATVLSFETYPGGPAADAAAAGENVAITLDRPLFAERGSLLVHAAADLDGGSADGEGDRIDVRLFWLDGDPLLVGRRLTLRIGATTHPVAVAAIQRVIDVESLAHAAAAAVERDGIADAVLTTRVPVLIDTIAQNPVTGRGVLTDGDRVVGACVVRRIGDGGTGRNLVVAASSVGRDERARRNGHRGGVIWLTGLSGAGKTTLAMALQRRFFDRGWQVAVLDGDALRLGLSRDLGFSNADRAENVRRTAETARVMADAGLVVVVALISPRHEDRQLARSIVGEGFTLVHVSADLETCRQRDPKGLYQRTAQGEIASFTGVSSPYEPPRNADLLVETHRLSQEAATELLGQLVEQRFTLPKAAAQ